MPSRTSEVGAVFLQLGLTAFGGPAAHVALFREEFVRRRAWVDDAEFLDLLSASNLIPGPTSTELAMHLGHRRAGWPGLVAAGVAFLLPAALIVGVLAWAYVAFGALPAVGSVLAGIAPVVVAIVAHATVGLGRVAVRSPATTLIAALAVVASLAGIQPIAVLIAGGVAGLVALGPTVRDVAGAASVGPIALLAQAAGPTAVSLAGLFLGFVKIGAILFGSGYLLIALIEADFVATGLLTERQLLDAIAVGQFTPGPVMTTATFVGYLLLGPAGALVATAGMALPAFLFVALSVPVLERLRASKRARAALDGVAAAVVGALIAVTADLGRAAIVDALTAALAILAYVGLASGRLNPVWLILGGAVVGAAIGGSAR